MIDSIITKLFKLYNNEEVIFEERFIKSYFNIDELYILFSVIKGQSKYYEITPFIKKIESIPNLFTEEDISYLLKKYNNAYLYKYLSQDKLYYILTKNPDEITSIISYLNDELYIKNAISIVEDNYYKALLVSKLNDEEKLNYLKEIDNDNKSIVIKSLKSDDIIKKNITLFSSNKGYFISSLSKDEEKEEYFKKYQRILNNNEKTEIIMSFKDREKILKYTLMCDNEVKANIILKEENDALTDAILSSIKSDNYIAKVLMMGQFNQDIVLKYINRVKVSEDLEYLLELMPYEVIEKYIDRLKEKDKIKLIKSSIYSFALFKYLDNKDKIFDIIPHLEYFPLYKEEYNYIIDMYAKKYMVNKDNLLYIAKTYSLKVLQVIENINIKNILNAKEDSFKTLTNLFNLDNLKMNVDSLNDLLNTLLQREFRINNSDIILTFAGILNLINENNKDEVIKNLENINAELSIKNIDMLMVKDSEAINKLHEEVANYIKSKRNNYIHEKMGEALDLTTKPLYERKSFVKEVVGVYPYEYLVNKFKKADLNKFNEEEKELIKNIDLVERIIKFKKHPSKDITPDIKENMTLFNNIVDKLFSGKKMYGSLVGLDSVNKIYQFKSVDSEKIIDVFRNIDFKMLEQTLFNQDVYNDFVKIWNQYKIGGWGNNFEIILERAGLKVDCEVIANFMNYFSLTYNTLLEKVKKGNIQNISLSSLLDASFCYGSDALVYSQVLSFDNYKMIAGNPGPNASTLLKEDRINKALKYVKEIRKRKYVSVPPIDEEFVTSQGKSLNISLGNFSNLINLTFGERTGSCMRIGGAGDSLFKFCLTNDNGFHIRFTSPKGNNFISRVSGFRNGNTVFLNELRYSVDSNYSNEDLVEACKFLAEKLIELTKNSESPIENVVITPFYAMENSGLKTTYMDNVNPKLGLPYFYTDVSDSVIVLKSINDDNRLANFKLGKNTARYPVLRDRQNILYDDNAKKYVEHLKALDSYLSGVPLDNINVSENNIKLCIGGEDWYVSLDNDGKIDSYVMNNSNNKEMALKEMDVAIQYLNKLNIQDIEREVGGR